MYLPPKPLLTIPSIPPEYIYQAHFATAMTQNKRNRRQVISHYVMTY
jgi:hypothetical protein